MSACGRKILIQAIGNPSRGDDALGPLMIERLPDGPYLKEWHYQLQVEHSEQWSNFDLVVLIDAHAKLDVPAKWLELEPIDVAPSFSSHSLSPGAVLGLTRRYFTTTPEVRLLALQSESFELGQGPTPTGQRALEEGFRALIRFLNLPLATRNSEVPSL